jgi:hypothetical protein
MSVIGLSGSTRLKGGCASNAHHSSVWPRQRVQPHTYKRRSCTGTEQQKTPTLMTEGCVRIKGASQYCLPTYKGERHWIVRIDAPEGWVRIECASQ